MNPENLFFFCLFLSGKNTFFIDEYKCSTYREKSCPCTCEMKSLTEQETYCNSQIKRKKHFSIKNSPSKCLGVFAVKVFCKSCRALTEIVGAEDAGTVESICTFEGTPLKCRGKKNRIQRNERIHILRKKSEKKKSQGINQETDEFQSGLLQLV